MIFSSFSESDKIASPGFCR